MPPALDRLFGLLCGQDPARSWVFAGEAFPLCARCAGIYAGLALATVLLVALRPRPTRAFLGAHGLCLLQIAPMGLGLVPQGPALRAASGHAFALGLAAFLLAGWLERRAPAGARARSRAYACAAALSLAATPALAWASGRVGAWALAALSLAGLGALCGLAGLQAVRLAASIAARRSRKLWTSSCPSAMRTAYAWDADRARSRSDGPGRPPRLQSSP
ncbi:MAG: DUF2085 domain-containing protein [Planctomycetes bacterium]|nr:DUF2085 domain-containing protein [Planctomycetota bacterium]